jgi:hypothetical protein
VSNTSFVHITKPNQDFSPSHLKYWLKVKITFRPAVYHQSDRLGFKPLKTHDQRFFNWNLTVIVLIYHPRWREDGFVSYEYAWSFVKCTYHTYSMLLKILPFVLYTCTILCQYRLCKADYACLTYLMLQRQISLLTFPDGPRYIVLGRTA